MSVVVRFNTVIVRKASIDARYTGGLDQYRRDVVSEVIDYYEDAHLTVAISMGGFNHYWDRLMESGLIYETGDKVLDFVTADQVNGIDPRCDWLDSIECNGFLVSWLHGSDSGYIVDGKPGGRGRFIKRVAKTACPECSNKFTLGPAAQAIDIAERRSGPLAVVQENPTYADTQFIVSCAHCCHECIFDQRGRQVDTTEGGA